MQDAPELRHALRLRDDIGCADILGDLMILWAQIA
jgi:hypothetical protein